MFSLVVETRGNHPLCSSIRRKLSSREEAHNYTIRQRLESAYMRVVKYVLVLLQFEMCVVASNTKILFSYEVSMLKKRVEFSVITKVRCTFN